MFRTKKGFRSRLRTYHLNDLASSYTDPNIHDVVAIVMPVEFEVDSVSPEKQAAAKPAKSSKAAKKKKELITSDVGKLALAFAGGSGGLADVAGIVIAVHKTAGGGVQSLTVVPPGEEAELGEIVDLDTLQSFGQTTILYLSADQPGTLTGTPPSPDGHYLRRICRLPRFASAMTEADLDLDNPMSIGIEIIEETTRGLGG